MAGIFSSLLLLGAYIGAGAIVGLLGSRRKLGAWGFFFASLLLTPLIGLLLFIVAAPPPERPQR
jgi:phosphate/sulfate permease